MKECQIMISILLTALLMQSCATIICGTHQTITINPTQANVRVTVICEGLKWSNGTWNYAEREPVIYEQNDGLPLFISVPRRSAHVTVRVEKNGYRPQQYVLTRTVNGWVFGNLIFGGLIGFVIDLATGACFALTPDYLIIPILEQEQSDEKVSLLIWDIDD